MDEVNEQDAADDDRSKTRIFDYEKAKRLEEEERARIRATRAEFLQKLMRGPDVLSWVAPKDAVVADEVLREHLAQLQKVVRYALQFAVSDDESIQLQLSAATTATNMIRANIALAKALNEPKSKTGHGRKRRLRPQD
jgi:hypothetical protein